MTTAAWVRIPSRSRSSSRSSNDKGLTPVAAGRQAHADPPGDVRPDRPAADAGGGRGVRDRRVARRVREGGRPAARLARTTASGGGGTGSTSPATPTPRATSSRKSGATRSRTRTATRSSARSTTTCRTTSSSSSRSPPTGSTSGDDKRPLAAMGFLTLGRRFLQQPARHHRRPHRRRDPRHDGPDRQPAPAATTTSTTRSRRRTTTRCTACSRAAPSRRSCRSIGAAERRPQPRWRSRRSWRSAEAAVETFLAEAARRARRELRAGESIADYLLAGADAHRHAGASSTTIADARTLNRAWSPRWAAFLDASKRRRRPGLRAVAGVRRDPAGGVRREGAGGHRAARRERRPAKPINPLVAEAFARQAAGDRCEDVAERYGELLATVRRAEAARRTPTRRRCGRCCTAPDSPLTRRRDCRRFLQHRRRADGSYQRRCSRRSTS